MRRPVYQPFPPDSLRHLVFASVPPGAYNRRVIENISVTGLRGIAKAEIAGFGRANVFVGPNGSGKSAILEALGIWCAGEDPAAAFAALATRDWLGPEGMRFWLDPKNGAEVIVSKGK